jgi:hypothetical protein
VRVARESMRGEERLFRVATRMAGVQQTVAHLGVIAIRALAFGMTATAQPYRANFWNLMRFGIRLSAPSLRFLSSS